MAARKTKSTQVKKTTRSTASTRTPRLAKIAPKKEVLAKTTQPETKTPPTSSRAALAALRVRRQYVIGGLIIIALIGLAVYYRQLFVVAMVNGQPVTRLAYIKETESVYIPDARVTAGKQALNQLITKTLILQEARRRNIIVSDKEIDNEIAGVRKSLEKSGQKLESALALQGDTLVAYRERIRIQKMLEKLVGTLTVSDKEVNEYIEKNKESLPQEMSADDLKKQVAASLKQQKFNEKVQTLLQDLQKKAKVTYFVQQ